MKVLIPLIILIGSFFTPSSTISSKVDIEFGRGMMCTGRGLCKIYNAPSESENLHAELIYSPSEGEIKELIIPNEIIDETNAEYQFQNDYITVYHNIFIYMEQAETNLSISPGIYPYEVSDSTHTIFL